MSCTDSPPTFPASIPTLPGDDVRQVMWRFKDRYDLQMAVQSARQVARGVAARLVANGERRSHDWNERKASLLEAFDQTGLTALYMDEAEGGFITGPKNLALCLVAFELAWVDAGAATCSLAGNLALAPIHERGTPEQKHRYMRLASPTLTQPTQRGAFALTEPIPYVGVDTGVLQGRVRIAEWPENGEPILQVEKRGRFITNMDFANFVTAAVSSDDPRIKGSCMVILEETDAGLFDRGAPTQKLVHQLSSTRDPNFSLRVPASRIIGGYTVENGVIVPRYAHSEIIAAVFHRTRIPVGLMSAAKLLSALEPVIRYQRGRFRGGEASQGSPRFDLGLQMNEDVTHRLINVWATGEAAASMGFAAAREADDFDAIEKEKERICAEQGLTGRKQLMALKKKESEAIDYLTQRHLAESPADSQRLAALEADTLVQFVLREARANILNPATKLWNTGIGAVFMREAVALMGGYGTTEDCPGFLPQKWMDAQLEATYEGPEAVQRRHLTATMTGTVFQTYLNVWIKALRTLGAQSPETGAAQLAEAFVLWQWTCTHLQTARDPDGKVLYHSKRQGVTFPLADALCWLLASKFLIEDVVALKTDGPSHPVLAETLPAWAAFYADLSRVQTGRAAGEAIRLCSELVYGYATNPAGASFDTFDALRTKIERLGVGVGLAHDRAAEALTRLTIPEALDYPA